MILETWLQRIKSNKLKAYNKVVSKEVSLCFNFLQIPDTDIIVMTMTVMKNQVKKNAMNPTIFSKVLSCIEKDLLESYSCYDSENEVSTEFSEIEPYCFCATRDKLSNSWYFQLNCHRIFFIPESSLWSTIKYVFNRNSVQTIKGIGVSEISVFVCTDKYDCNMKFF